MYNIYIKVLIDSEGLKLIVLIVFKIEVIGGFKVDIKMYNIDGKI